MIKHGKKIALAATLVATAAGLASCGNSTSYITYTAPETLVEFGAMPTTVVEDENIIAQLDALSLKTNRTTEIDGVTYFKATAEPHTTMVTSNSGNVTFVEDETYYFIVEPIKWRVLSDDGTNYTLMSEYVLSTSALYTATYRTWESLRTYYSAGSLYDYLNNDLMSYGFSGVSSSLISTTFTDTYVNSNAVATKSVSTLADVLTNDAETLAKYGLSEQASRIALTTDYARAIGTWMSIEEETYGYGTYWTRSGLVDESTASYTGYGYFINEQGEIKYDYGFTSSHGVRPIITVAKSNF